MSPSLSLPSAVEVVEEDAAFSVAERSKKEGEDDEASTGGDDDDDDDGRARIGMRLGCCCRSATDPPPRAPVCAVARCMMMLFEKRGFCYRPMRRSSNAKEEER